ncbi:MAG: LysR substrate-binding domain-containing protein [Clostridium fessum]
MIRRFFVRDTLAGGGHLMCRDLARKGFIIMQPQGVPTMRRKKCCICYNKGGFIPNIVAREREVQTVLLEVSAGFGVAILPEYAVRHYRNARNLVVVPLPSRGLAARKSLILRSAWRQTQRIRRLKSCCSGRRHMSMLEINERWKLLFTYLLKGD